MPTMWSRERVREGLAAIANGRSRASNDDDGAAGPLAPST